MAGTSPAMTMESAVLKIIMIALAVATSAAAHARPLPGGFVFLREIDPSIIQDIRYAGSNNFIGRPLAGYDAAECVVKRDVGLALRRIQQELALRNLSLKMLDCYRPARASHDMVVWAQNGRETLPERRYNPAFSKADLFRLGYIAEHSGHSTGAAVDLTLVDLKADNSAVFDPAKTYADCTAPADARAPEGSVDMGAAMIVPTSRRIPRRLPSRRRNADGETCCWPRWQSKALSTIRRRGGIFRCPARAGPPMIFRSRRGGNGCR
jgi:D-alanyl-D-alanine dipeptidase